MYGLNDLSESGVTEETSVALIDHTASYTLLPTEAYEQFFLDIGVSGYWQDYLPLSYFAQYVTNDVGNQYYDLDFLQFNIPTLHFGLPTDFHLVMEHVNQNINPVKPALDHL